jgi:hypothetical protein
VRVFSAAHELSQVLAWLNDSLVELVSGWLTIKRGQFLNLLLWLGKLLSDLKAVVCLRFLLILYLFPAPRTDGRCIG